MKFQLEAFHRDIPDRDLLDDLRTVALAIGDSKLTLRKYDALGKYSGATICTRFGTWNHALNRAGIGISEEKNADEDDLFANLYEVWMAVGRQPKYRDLTRDRSRYSSSTYASRYGGWRDALARFSDWANSADLSEHSNGRASAPVQRTAPVPRRTTRAINLQLRVRVLMRDGATCRLCGASPSEGAKLEVDHIAPWSKGGETTLENLQILCFQCNRGKGDFVPERAV